MSQYYIPSRRPTYFHAPASSPTTADEDLNDVDNSIYIFPNPFSSNPQSSPGSSVFSTPTDHDLYRPTVLSISRARSRDDSSRTRSELSYVNVSSGTHTSFSTGTDTPNSLEVSDWNADLEEEEGISESVVEVEAEPRPTMNWSRWDVVRMPLRPTRLQDSYAPARLEVGYVRSRTHSPSTTTMSFKSSLDEPDMNPHPRVRIPLLSIVASLFSIDESTLHLLTHSTSHHGSVLFPGHTLPAGDLQSESSTVVDDQGGSESTSVHGFHKLLLSSDISSESWKNLKRGFAVVCNTSPVPSIGIFRLWGLVNQVWINGERTVKEVWGGAVH